jgi:hypothetical protein
VLKAGDRRTLGKRHFRYEHRCRDQQEETFQTIHRRQAEAVSLPLHKTLYFKKPILEKLPLLLVEAVRFSCDEHLFNPSSR